MRKARRRRDLPTVALVGYTNAGKSTLLNRLTDAGVLAENSHSLALHQRVGFRLVGVQERLGQDPHGRWRDVVLLERRSASIGPG